MKEENVFVTLIHLILQYFPTGETSNLVAIHLVIITHSCVFSVYPSKLYT